MEEYLPWILSRVQPRRLFERVCRIWIGYLRYPFVCWIGDGSLDKENFIFTSNRTICLIDYARVFVVGIAKSNDAEVIRFFSNVIHHIFTSEMNIHRAYMQRFGVTVEEFAYTTPFLDNRSYVSYMLRVAYEDGFWHDFIVHPQLRIHHKSDRFRTSAGRFTSVLRRMDQWLCKRKRIKTTIGGLSNALRRLQESFPKNNFFIAKRFLSSVRATKRLFWKWLGRQDIDRKILRL